MGAVDPAGTWQDHLSHTLVAQPEAGHTLHQGEPEIHNQTAGRQQTGQTGTKLSRWAWGSRSRGPWAVHMGSREVEPGLPPSLAQGHLPLPAAQGAVLLAKDTYLLQSDKGGVVTPCDNNFPVEMHCEVLQQPDGLLLSSAAPKQRNGQL